LDPGIQVRILGGQLEAPDVSADPAYPIQHDGAASQFTMDVDGQTAYLAYRLLDDHTIEYYSTFVPPELRRRDIGGTLVRHALAYAAERGLAVIPSCWFVKRVMEKGGQGGQGR
jgi:predicted GNAT family acetyltransferase